MPVSFLVRRVSKSDVDDLKKLIRVLACLKRIIEEKRVIGAMNLAKILTFINVLCAVYDNLRSHMGGMISLGLGIVHSESAIENLNEKSTCESEVIATTEYLLCNLWVLLFLQAQKDVRSKIM